MKTKRNVEGGKIENSNELGRRNESERGAVVQTVVIDQIGIGGGENTMMITEEVLLQRGVGGTMTGRGRGVGIGTEIEEVRRTMMMRLHLVEMIAVREEAMITMITGKLDLSLSFYTLTSLR